MAERIKLTESSLSKLLGALARDHRLQIGEALRLTTIHRRYGSIKVVRRCSDSMKIAHVLLNSAKSAEYVASHLQRSASHLTIQAATLDDADLATTYRDHAARFYRVSDALITHHGL